MQRGTEGPPAEKNRPQTLPVRAACRQIAFSKAGAALPGRSPLTGADGADGRRGLLVSPALWSGTVCRHFSLRPGVAGWAPAVDWLDEDDTNSRRATPSTSWRARQGPDGRAVRVNGDGRSLCERRHHMRRPRGAHVGQSEVKYAKLWRSGVRTTSGNGQI